MGYSVSWKVTLGGNVPREIEGQLVTCNYFDVLQVNPAVGAGFSHATCDATGAPASVILSHDLWTTAFSADPDIVRKSVTLNRQPFEVVGVAPVGFHGVGLLKASFFAPVSTLPTLRPEQKDFRDASASWLSLVGRRKNRIGFEQVRAELSVISAQIDRQYPGRTTILYVMPATMLSIPQARRDVFSAASVVLAAFGLVLLIACANVANLLLARAERRTKEIAVRLSIGASRGRLIRQLLTESLIIAFAGGAAGSLLAWWSLQALPVAIVSSLPGTIPMPNFTAQPSMTVFWFALGLSSITALAFGLLPALQASKPDIQTALKQEGVGPRHAPGGWLRGLLIGVQVAVCTVLLISAGLLLRALHAAQVVEPGFDYRNVATVSFDLRGAGYNELQAATFQHLLSERIGSLPAVSAVAQADKTPLSPGRRGTTMRLPGQNESHEIDIATVSPDYFSLVGIPIVRGRTFTATELNESRAAIVPEATAQRYWPGQDPIGQTFIMYSGPNEATPREIVGVTRDAQVSRIAQVDSSYAYLPAGLSAQHGLSVMVRSEMEFSALAAGVLVIARELDPDLVVRVNRLEENLDFWRSVSRLTASVSGSLSLFALVLASIGVYGVVSYVVGRRMREVGIRIMLGASAREIRLMILRQTLRPVAIGLAIGITTAMITTQVLQSLLFGIDALDPIAFAGAPLILSAVAIAASIPSIRRAIRLDPMTTLRYE